MRHEKKWKDCSLLLFLAMVALLPLANIACEQGGGTTGGGGGGGGGGTITPITPADSDVLNAKLAAAKVAGFDAWLNANYDRAQIAEASCRMSGFGALRGGKEACKAAQDKCSGSPLTKSLAADAPLRFTDTCDLTFSDAKTFLTLLKDAPAKDKLNCDTNWLGGGVSALFSGSWQPNLQDSFGILVSLSNRLETCVKTP